MKERRILTNNRNSGISSMLLESRLKIRHNLSPVSSNRVDQKQHVHTKEKLHVKRNRTKQSIQLATNVNLEKT